MSAELSKKSIWIGRVISALVVLFLGMDGVVKFFLPPPVTTTFAQLGLPLSLAIPLGALVLACVVLYLIPRTAVLGVILLTGYLGGAVAIHVRVGDPLFSHVLFPVYIGVLAWVGLYLRDARVRGMVS